MAEQQGVLAAMKAATEEAETNWNGVGNSITELRTALISELRNSGQGWHNDLDQLETLLVPGEACCVSNIIPEFLAKLREFNLSCFANRHDFLPDHMRLQRTWQ